ncbi:MAG: TonB C-terminal domain-containing protein, partial [Candidatus Methylopumilus sp.]|nr:TonB C-terminal domain-containing protein [Candidatus Methylopumilus sp.]
MIRPQEKIIARKAAVYALSVHIALILIMVVSLEWRIKLPQVAEVELWDSIPQPSAKVIEPLLVEKKVEPELPKPVEKPSKVEVIIKSLTSDKADISLKQTKEEERKKEEEQKKKDELKKIQESLLKQDQLAKLQQELLQDKSKPTPIRESDTKQANPHPTEGGAKLGEIDKYKVLIQRKIQQNVNKQLCGVNPIEIQFEIGLMPTGELMGNPKMLKSSGIAVCDESVERAIF